MDKGRKTANKQLNKIEKQIRKTYKGSATKDGKPIIDYLNSFIEKDKENLEKVKAGTMTEEAYLSWRRSILSGKEWNKVLSTASQKFVVTDITAIDNVSKSSAKIYLANRKSIQKGIQRATDIGIRFDIVNKKTLQKLSPKERFVLKPKVDVAKDMDWHQKRIQSAIRAGIEKGEAIPKIAKRLEQVSRMDRNAAVRNARTAVTSAENAGRLDGMREGIEKGIALQKQWYATMDDRVRASHEEMHLEIAEVEEPFSNGLMYPADPDGDPAEVYNCRCTMLYVIDGKAMEGA